MTSTQSHMVANMTNPTPLTFDDAMAALVEQPRRRLLMHLHTSTTNTVSMRDLTQSNDDITQAELVHKHLPKLDEMDVVDWDREAGTVERGPRWDDIAPLLEAIIENQDEMPSGWL